MKTLLQGTDVEKPITLPHKTSARQWKRNLRKTTKSASKRERSRAELFGKLASYPSLNGVTKREQQALLTLASKTGFSFAHVLAPLRPEGNESQWTVIQHVHSIVRPFLTRFLDGEPTPLRPLAECERAEAYLTRAGHVHFMTGGEGLQEEMLVELWRLVRQGDAFPLRRCVHCKTRIFVKIRRQRYCSVSCRNKANEARRDPDERRAYQRQLMRDRRKYGMEPKRSKKKARSRAVKSRGTSQRNRG